MIKGQKAFTLLELMIVLVVLGILVAFSLAGFQGYYQDQTTIQICETNQKVLQAAVKLYAYDNNALPGSLSRLRPKDLDRAYALVCGGKRPNTLLAYLREVWEGEVAEAVALSPRYYQNNPKFLKCPADRDGNGVSYQINSALANGSLSDLLKASDNTVLIFDSDVVGDGADPEAGLQYRHRGETYAVVTTVVGDHPPKKKPGSGAAATGAFKPFSSVGGNRGGGGGDDGNKGEQEGGSNKKGSNNPAGNMYPEK